MKGREKSSLTRLPRNFRGSRFREMIPFREPPVIKLSTKSKKGTSPSTTTGKRLKEAEGLKEGRSAGRRGKWCNRRGRGEEVDRLIRLTGEKIQTRKGKCMLTVTAASRTHIRWVGSQDGGLRNPLEGIKERKEMQGLKPIGG